MKTDFLNSIKQGSDELEIITKDEPGGDDPIFHITKSVGPKVLISVGPRLDVREP